MLKLDECDPLLVTNPFAEENSTVSFDGNPNDIFAALQQTLHTSSDHPLCSRSVSPAPRSSTPSIPSVTIGDSEGEAQPRLTSLPAFDGSSADVVVGESWVAGSANAEVPQGGSDAIIHPVGPHDSFAGVALRYGVSIAALRRANQLWSSDPIHFRTELIIPRGDTLRASHKPARNPGTGAILQSTAEPPHALHPDLVASSFVAARNMILSVLPARMSLDSLSSKASASEDHELDDLQTARVHYISAVEVPLTQDDHELSILPALHPQYKPPGIPLSNTDNHQHTDHNHISRVGALRSRSISSSPNVSLERLPRIQPFSVLPVRTSQLEPEPAMELPARRSRI